MVVFGVGKYGVALLQQVGSIFSETTQSIRPISVLTFPVGAKGVADDSLACSRGHLAAQAFPRSAVARYVNALLVLRGCLDPPDQRLDRLDLAEVEGIVPAVSITPVFDQAARDRGDTGTIGFAPRADHTVG